MQATGIALGGKRRRRNEQSQPNQLDNGSRQSLLLDGLSGSERLPIRRPVPWMFKLALLAFSLIFAVAASEIAVRCCSDEGTSLLVKDSIVGQRYRAGFAEERYVPEAGRVIPLRFNRIGYRGADLPVEKPAGTRRVAVLGDSFIAGVAVEEPDTLVGQLETMLNQDSRDYRWESLNFGVSGNGTGQSLLAWRNFVHQFNPDVVILCFYNGNDLADNCSGASSAHRPYFHLDNAGQLAFQPVSRERVTLSRWLSDYSQLYVWQKHKFRLIRDRFRQAANILPPGFQIFNTSPPAPFPEAWSVTEHLIATLAQEVQKSGATFLFVGIPAHEQVMDRLGAATPNGRCPSRRPIRREPSRAAASRDLPTTWHHLSAAGRRVPGWLPTRDASLCQRRALERKG